MEQKKKSKKNLKNMTKEQIQEALKRKKEGNAKALQIVETLIDNIPTEDEFLHMLFDINQSHYQDIVEERVILKKCGYVLCANVLESIPKKQFHISTLQNRVFDITERKNFCSNICFKSSNYIKDQMLTSPLWMRDTEKVPDFKLLSQFVSGKDITGNEIDLGHKRVKPSEIDKPVETNDVTTLEELMSDIDNAIKENKLFPDSDKSYPQDKQDPSIEINKTDPLDNSNESLKTSDVTSEPTGIVKEEVNTSITDKTIVIETNTGGDIITEPINEENSGSTKHDSPNTDEVTSKVEIKYNLVKEIIENKAPIASSEKNVPSNTKRTHNSASTKPLKKSKSQNCDSKENDARKKILILESYLKQWISVDTLIFLLGESAVQNILRDANKHYKQHTEVMKQLNATSESNMNQLLGTNKQAYARYAALCKKLNILELAEEQEDSELTGKPSSTQQQQPVPDYEELKKQTEEMMIKVNEFYRGDKRQVTFAEEDINAAKDGEDDTPLVLPAVDLHAQKALRRKILLDKLNKIVPEVLRLIGASHLSLSTDLRNLVRTFNLTAHNVMVQAAEWSLVALVLLKMLSSKDSYLKDLLDSEQSTKHVTLICMSYGLDAGYLGRLHSWLLEPNHVIATATSS